MIWEELDDRLIFLKRREKSAEKLLEMAGEVFVQTGVAKSGYSQALLKREKAFPTGLDTGRLGIAIPHTESCWIRQNALGIIVPLEPVDFIRMGTDREHISVLKDWRHNTKFPETAKFKPKASLPNGDARYQVNQQATYTPNAPATSAVPPVGNDASAMAAQAMGMNYHHYPH